MAREQLRPHLGGDSLYLYYMQRDLEAFKKLWLAKYNEANIRGKYAMLLDLHNNYALFSRDIAELI